MPRGVVSCLKVEVGRQSLRIPLKNFLNVRVSQVIFLNFSEICAASREISVPNLLKNLKSFLLNFLSLPFLSREGILSKPSLPINLVLRKMLLYGRISAQK